MPAAMRRSFTVLALALASACASAQDYAREKRWESEIVPALVVGDPVKLRTAGGHEFLALYTEASNPRGAVVLAHGRNVHPDHGLIGALRMKLADRGYTTLSIQMPILGSDAQSIDEYYPRLFPEAAERLGIAARWLAQRGQSRLALVSHSMGAWMANEYFDAAADSPYRAWVSIGITGGFSWGTYGSPRPILDVSGSEDFPTVVDATWRRRMAIAFAPAGSRQVVVAGADHYFTARESDLARIVGDWLDEVLK
ncbi:MAG TPA: DUF3530 family protein [Usitatibacter sp.]|nr:DUF3530 family protein [Usitatibacter sp.]